VTSIKKGGVSLVVWMGVLKQYQNKGFGEALVKTWEEWVKGKGVHKLRVSTYKESNVVFYSKFGFELKGVRKTDVFGFDKNLLRGNK